MIQRVQSIWLFFATATLFSLFLFPYIHIFNPDASEKAIKVLGVYETINNHLVLTQPFLALTIATTILALIPFVIIFLYKNRKQQISVSYLTILAILGYSFWLVQAAKEVTEGIALQSENYGIGVFLPSLSILFIILAVRGIRRDEKLVKSVDRLRS